MKTNFSSKVRAMLLLASVFFISSCDILPDGISGASLQIARDGNSYYQQGEKKSMKSGDIKVVGEVEKEVSVDLKKIYKRSIVAKEFGKTPDGKGEFIGAYSYVGYSLHDILHPVKLKKKNSEIFRPNVDLYVEVENAKGEKVTFSWGELFFTHHPHQVLIAIEAAQVKPHKVETDYPVSATWRLIAANDFYNTRYLENPVKITVKSFDKKEYVVNRELDPLYASDVVLSLPGMESVSLNEAALKGDPLKYETVFYGMGMGYHPNDGFSGTSFNTLMQPYFNSLQEAHWKSGMVCFAAADGYRAVYSFSELFNSINPVHTMMVVQEENSVNGRFRVFHPGDFFADRSVKALNEVLFFYE